MKPLLVIGPLSKDFLIKDKTTNKVGGALYYQSFVFEKLNIPYTLVISLAKNDETLLNEFPDIHKIQHKFKNETITFTNKYINDKRVQYSNFADIPITIKEIQTIIKDNEYSAIILNPLLPTDFTKNFLKDLKKFNIPIYLSLQGFLRKSNKGKVELFKNPDITEILSVVEGLFLDENEANILFEDNPLDVIAHDLSVLGPSEVIITRSDKGSLIYSNVSGEVLSVPPVKVENVNYPTGSGDTFMAAYLSSRLDGYSINYSANFASKLTSEKIEKGDLNL